MIFRFCYIIITKNNWQSSKTRRLYFNILKLLIQEIQLLFDNSNYSLSLYLYIKKSILMYGFAYLNIYIYATSQVKPFQTDNPIGAILFDGPRSRGGKCL